MEEVQKYREKRRERRIRDRLRMIGKARCVARKIMFFEPDNPVEKSMWVQGWKDLDNHIHHKLDTWEEVFLARESWARRHYNDLRTCSCGCCGNERRHHNSMTVQEARAEEDARQQFREIGFNYKGVRFVRYFF